MDEEKEDTFVRHTRQYILQSLIRIEDLEHELIHPSEFTDSLKLLKEIKKYQLEAINACNMRMHTNFPY